jgi:ubiquinone/menaquinone biosynthesis C-methylase UbiE
VDTDGILAGVGAAKTPAQAYEEFFVPAIFQPCASALLDITPVKAAERVLDLACGTGVVTRAVAPIAGAAGHVTGLDLRPGMIAVASSMPAPDGAHVEWVEGDALALPFADRSFDVVLCQQGIQFFPDQPRAMREMRRVLAPGGRVGLAVWRALDQNEFFAAMTEVELRHLTAVGMTYEDLAGPFLFGDPEWLQALITDAGFGDVRVEPRAFEARFPAGGFVENVEFAYSAVIPEFAEDPAAFREFVAAVDRDMRDVLTRHRQGDEIVFPMHVNIGRGTAS